MSSTSVSFTVWGLPPVKMSGTSMWSDPLQAERLLRLRRAAAEAFLGRAPFTNKVSIHVDIRLAVTERSTGGDVDNALGGIMDGLQGLRGGFKAHPLFDKHGHDAGKAVAFKNDEQVHRAVIEKSFPSPIPHGDSKHLPFIGPFQVVSIEPSHYMVTVAELP